MPDLIADIAELRTIADRLDVIGRRVEPCVPASPDRDDHMDLAVRSIWNSKRCAQWAANEIERAISRAMKGGT